LKAPAVLGVFGVASRDSKQADAVGVPMYRDITIALRLPEVHVVWDDQRWGHQRIILGCCYACGLTGL